MFILLALLAALLGSGPDVIGFHSSGPTGAPVVATDVSGGGPAITSSPTFDVSGGGPAIIPPPPPDVSGGGPAVTGP